MRRPKPSLVDVVLLLILVAGALGLAFGAANVQAGGLMAVVLAVAVGIAIRPRRSASRRPDRADFTSREG